MNIVEELVGMLRRQADILEERAAQHGSFDVFERAAQIAETDVYQVLNCMCAIKKARLEKNPFNEDSLLDLMNYEAIQKLMKVRELQAELYYKPQE
jgi:hypothetical protein